MKNPPAERGAGDKRGTGPPFSHSAGNFRIRAVEPSSQAEKTAA